MANVAGVKANPKKPENAYIKFDDGTEAWCPSFELASKLTLGAPLPEGWRQDEGEYGPRVFPPQERKGGGGGFAPKAAFANTQEGMAYREERSDRRTALMQCGGDLAVAAEMYAWLRQTAGAGVPPAPSRHGATTPAPAPAPRPSTQESGVERSGGAAAHGEGAANPSDLDLKKSRALTHTHTYNEVAGRDGWLQCSECGVWQQM